MECSDEFEAKDRRESFWKRSFPPQVPTQITVYKGVIIHHASITVKIMALIASTLILTFISPHFQYRLFRVFLLSQIVSLDTYELKL